MVEVTVDAESLERLKTGALVHRMPAAIFAITGPGALQCLQGLITNDLNRAEDGSLIYGALLTPKGLIILDCWVIRQDATRFIFICDLDTRATAQEMFRKLLPPRLAKVSDLTDEWQVWRVLGPATPLPPAVFARLRSRRSSPAALERDAALPFTYLVAGNADDIAHTLKGLALDGARTATDDEWQAARILAGWPQRGAEIDEKTLVQEVRFDENGGVSYEKGCYTGQETVARLHFRGHTNRDLRGLTWSGTEPLTDSRVLVGEKEVGSIRSILTLPTSRFALALIRREVETGQVVTAGGVTATLTALPLP